MQTASTSRQQLVQVNQLNILTSNQYSVKKFYLVRCWPYKFDVLLFLIFMNSKSNVSGKNKLLLCYDCRMHFKVYGAMRMLSDAEKCEPPPYIFKAAFENLDGYTGRMRTRRSSTPVFAGNNVLKTKLVQQEGKVATNANRKQVTKNCLPAYGITLEF